MDNDKTITQSPRSDIIPTTLKNDHLGTMFYHKEQFEIVSFTRGATMEYTGPDDTTYCKNWKIEKANLYNIFKNSQSITGTTWDLAFAFSACVVTGKIKQNGQLFEYSVNAGSWFSITCRDTSLLFGDYKKSDRRFFLDSVEKH